MNGGWRHVCELGALCFFAYVLARRVGRLPLPSAVAPLFAPPLVGALLVCAVSPVLHVDRAAFASLTKLATMLLLPATVALGLPLYHNRAAIGRYAPVACIALVIGSLVSMASSFTLAWLFRLDSSLGAILGIKSATTAISLDIAAHHNLDPLTTATLVLSTGLFGAVAGPFVLGAAGIRHPIARGLAYGGTSHGIGTARALIESELSGAVSGMALCLNGVLLGLGAPLAMWLLLGR